ncbi:MAG: hypothetical protein DDT32_02317 [Syntrophomonadaceae bacterium]|nr:hypothetical protein [Bacillota bacterium]
MLLQAIAEGRPIPPEVLDDYPDLRLLPEVSTEEWFRNRWNGSKISRRVELVMEAGWVTREGRLTKLGEKITQSKWDELSPAAQAVLRRKLEKLYSKSVTGELSPAEDLMAKTTPQKEPEWGEPFRFRGLMFREHSEGIGIQVYDPDGRKWRDTAIFNRRYLEKNYREIPDIAMWDWGTRRHRRRAHLGTLRFETEEQKLLPSVESVPAERIPSPEIMTEYRIWTYGPDKEAPPKMHELWANVLKDIEKRYPLTAPILLAEAKRKKISPLEMRFFMAHNEWVEKREEISKKRHRAYTEEDQKEGSEAEALARKWAGKKKNIALLRKDIELLRTKYDVEGIEEAINEYADIERSDYDDAEEYQDARDEAWQAILDALDDVEELEEEEEDEEEENDEEEKDDEMKEPIGKTIIKPVPKPTLDPAVAKAKVIPLHSPPRGRAELEFLADSSQHLAQTIDAIGYRTQIDNTFQEAIARAKGLRL